MVFLAHVLRAGRPILQDESVRQEILDTLADSGLREVLLKYESNTLRHREEDILFDMD
jgi:hypothetical protein